MPQAVVLLLFSALLVFCVASGLSILYALAGGYLLFAGFAVFRGYGLKEVWEMSIEGVRTVSGILITFLFIGMLTASWRAAGTIPDILYPTSSVRNFSSFSFSSRIHCSRFSRERLSAPSRPWA